MNDLKKMEVALRRNEQLRRGNAFLNRLKKAAVGDGNIALLPIEETFFLEKLLKGFGTDERSLREIGLSWQDVEQRLAEWIDDCHEVTCSVLLCSVPSISFRCSLDSLITLVPIALIEDGDTICIVDKGRTANDIAIDRYQEGNGIFLYEFDRLRK